MHDSAFHVLFLGEDRAWSRVSQCLLDAPRLNLKIHRAQSLNELFLVLAGGAWHAVALDLHAWNYQGLHYVNKLRAEYPAFPILALYFAAANDLGLKARNSGASRCLTLETLTAEAIHSAVVSCLSERKFQSHLRKAPPIPLNYSVAETSSSVTSSKTQVISHALNNLLCVINANADILAEQLGASGPGVRSLSEIKKAAKSASDLMRLLK
jgi:DNA-binding NarL/FixJ family response regulator